MNNQTETFQRFGKAFQEKFCHIMLSDRPFCDQVAEVLNVEFLTMNIFVYSPRFSLSIEQSIRYTLLMRSWNQESEQNVINIQKLSKNSFCNSMRPFLPLTVLITHSTLRIVQSTFVVNKCLRGYDEVS